MKNTVNIKSVLYIEYFLLSLTRILYNFATLNMYKHRSELVTKFQKKNVFYIMIALIFFEINPINNSAKIHPSTLNNYKRNYCGKCNVLCMLSLA